MDWLIQSSNCDFGNAPIFSATTSPFLKISNVGMPRTLYFCGVKGFSSIFNFTIEMLSPLSSEISSNAGPIALHGPHHSAQKSTKTGLSDCKTSAEKSVSVVLEVAIVTHPIAVCAHPLFVIIDHGSCLALFKFMGWPSDSQAYRPGLFYAESANNFCNACCRWASVTSSINWV